MKPTLTENPFVLSRYTEIKIGFQFGFNFALGKKLFPVATAMFVKWNKGSARFYEVLIHFSDLQQEKLSLVLLFFKTNI